MRGFKATNSDMTCIGYQYELGKTFEMPIEEVRLCKSGFHYCPNLVNVFDYYGLGNGNRFFEVEAEASVDESADLWMTKDKLATHKITFVRELTDDEIYEGFDKWLKKKSKGEEITGQLADGKLLNKKLFEILRQVRYGGIHYHSTIDMFLGLFMSEVTIEPPTLYNISYQYLNYILRICPNFEEIINQTKDWYQYKYKDLPDKFDRLDHMLRHFKKLQQLYSAQRLTEE